MLVSYPIEALFDFVNNQEDDRPINMRAADSTRECGCILVHFGKEVAKIGNTFTVGYIHGETLNGLEGFEFTSDKETPFFITNCCAANVCNYGEAKRILQEYLEITS